MSEPLSLAVEVNVTQQSLDLEAIEARAAKATKAPWLAVGRLVLERLGMPRVWQLLGQVSTALWG